MAGGGHVVIGCRDSRYFGAEADQHKQTLCSQLQCHRDQIKIVKLDLSDLSSVRRFCQQVSQDLDRIGD